MRCIVSLLLGLFVALGPLATMPALAQPATCQFVLGFKTLHDLIPNIVGNCLENERHNGFTGDGLQATTNGLLVWRKADNFTAFTDGFRTWVNGPNGIQVRLNTQRFPFESDFATIGLRNAVTNAQYTIPGLFASPITFTLANGRANFMVGQSRVSVVLDQDNIAFGDLNGDGSTDAAVRLTINTGGSGVFNFLVAMLNRGDNRVQQAATFALGDRVQVQQMTIDNGVITVQELAHGPTDPLCCPTVPTTLRFSLVGGQLQQQ
jgi:hypothetical protein